MLNRFERGISTVIFLIVTMFLVLDIQEDLNNGSSMEHVSKEVFIVLLGLFGILYLQFKYFISRRSIKQGHIDLQRVEADLEIYKSKTQNLIQGLSQKIDEQLELWNLTKAEKEISLLILKGLSSKEIAEIRNTTDATIRQQTASIYKKSQLKGRSELSAFFLEDLLI